MHCLKKLSAGPCLYLKHVLLSEVGLNLKIYLEFFDCKKGWINGVRNKNFQI